jgi:sugar lactone lactonase YvrE
MNTTYHGDGLPAATARVTAPSAVAVDGTTGDLYIAHSALSPNNAAVIRKVDAFTGRITTIAGPSASGQRGNGGPARSAWLGFGVTGLAVSHDGASLFVADKSHTVRRIDLLSANLTIAHFAGNPAATMATSANVEGLANVTALHFPQSLDVGPDGSVFISESFGVRRVWPNGNMTTVAGCGGNSAAACSGTADGVPARFSLLQRTDAANGVSSNFNLGLGGGIAVHPSGSSFYIAETLSGRIRRVDLVTGVITSPLSNNVTDIRAVNPQFANVDPRRRTLLVADAGAFQVLALNLTSGISSILAGSGSAGTTTPTNIVDNLAPLSAAFASPVAAAADADGNVYVADIGAGAIRVINITTNRVRTVAFRSLSGPAATASDCNNIASRSVRCEYNMRTNDVPAGLPLGNTTLVPAGIRFDAAGRVLYFADPIYHRVRTYDTRTGLVSTFAGSGNPVQCGDGGPAILAGFGGVNGAGSGYTGQVSGLAVNSRGDVYVSDMEAGTVRQISSVDGTITVVLGLGGLPNRLSGVPGSLITLQSPRTLAVDPLDNLYFWESGANIVRKWDPITNNLTTVWGTSGVLYSGFSAAVPDIPFVFNTTIERALSNTGVLQIAVNARGDICIAENRNVVRCIINGTMWRVAGTALLTPQVTAFSPPARDGIWGTSGAISQTSGVAFTPDGNGLYISGSGIGAIRLLNFSTVTDGNYSRAIISSVYGIVDPATKLLNLATPTLADLIRDGARADTTVSAYGRQVAVNATNGELFVVQESELTSVLIKTVRGNVPSGRGTVSILVGNRDQCSIWNTTSGSLARNFTMAPLQGFVQIALLPDGSVLFTDNIEAKIWRLSKSSGAGAVVELFGGGGSPNGCDGGLATRAALNTPNGVGVDASGNVYVAETGFSRVRRVDAITGLISTVAGAIENVRTAANGFFALGGFIGDGGPAALARLSAPTDVVTNDDGTLLFIADKGNNRVRMVDVSGGGTISTFSGNFMPSAVLPEDMRASQVYLQSPHGLAWDNRTRTLYVSEAGGGKVRGIPLGL